MIFGTPFASLAKGVHLARYFCLKNPIKIGNALAFFGERVYNNNVSV